MRTASAVTQELVQGCRSCRPHAPEHVMQPGEWLNAATARRKDNVRNTGRRPAALMAAEEGPVAMADALYRLARSVAGFVDPVGCHSEATSAFPTTMSVAASSPLSGVRKVHCGRSRSPTLARQTVGRRHRRTCIGSFEERWTRDIDARDRGL